MPCRRSSATTASPTGPAPSTTAASAGVTAERATACRPTAIGSVSAARRWSSPFGTFMHIAAESRIRSAYAPL